MTGAADAPKIGDKAAWADRISQGTDALVNSAINGIPGTAMLARGTCNACSDDDLKLAVDYMISQSQ
jgi:cytochrome c5